MTTSSTTTTRTTRTTVGVAIAVPDPWGARLQDYRATLGDDTAGTIPTHVTLMPPLDVTEGDVPGLERHLAEASAEGDPFWIHLRGTGTFRPVSPVVFVTVAEGISACEQLALSVGQGPVRPEQRFPYHPHVTVAHHLADDVLDRAFTELADFECDFVVDEFSLYVHDVARGWVPSRHFSLSTGDGPG